MRSTSATRDISGKPATLRIAKAASRLRVKPATIRALRAGRVPKEDPVGAAKIAAIQAAKETSRIIPFCHNIPIDAVSVTITAAKSWIDVETSVTAVWKTGVEMEALTAASAAALTLYDMLKPIDDSLEIVGVRLTHKSGGKSGTRGAAVNGRAGSKPKSKAGAGTRAAVLVLSDRVSAGKARDLSGAILADALRSMGASVAPVRVLPDDRRRITAELKRLCDSGKVDLVLATGGTGVGPRDVTAEAAAEVIDRRLHGVENAFLSYGQARVPSAMLSRCVAGTRKSSIVVALPGSPSAARDAIAALFPALFHAFPVMRGGGHS